MKKVLLLIFIAFVCYGIWFAVTVSNCKKNSIPIKNKLAELWSEPFWPGPKKLERARDTVFPIIGFVIFIVYTLYRLITFSYISEKITFLSDISINSRFYLMFLLAITLFLSKHSLKQRLCVGLVELYFFVDIFIIEKNIWLNTCSSLIPVFTLILVAKELKLEKVLKVYFVLSAAFFAVTSILSTIGVIGSGDQTTLYSRGSEDGWLNMRYALGFTYPNSTGILLATIVVMWFIIRNDKIKWWDWVIYAAAAIVITFVIDSRGALLFLIVFAIAFIVFKHFPKLYNFKFLKYPAVTSPAIFTFVTLLCVLFYDNNNIIWSTLNRIATGRLDLSQKLFNNYKFTFFGQIVDKNFDNIYLSTYLQNGIVVLFIIVTLYCVLIKRLWNRKATPELALTLSYLVYSFIEARLFIIIFNISLYLLASIILLEPESKQQLFHSETKDLEQISRKKNKKVRSK